MVPTILTVPQNINPSSSVHNCPTLQVEAAHSSTKNELKVVQGKVQGNLFKIHCLIFSDILKATARQQNARIAGKASLIYSVTWLPALVHETLQCTDSRDSSFCSNASPFSSTCFWERGTYPNAILKQAILWSRIEMNMVSPLTNAGRQVCWHSDIKESWKLAQ